MKNLDKTFQRLLILAIIVMVNFLSLFLYIRIDLTKTQAYSLSRATKRTISDLDDYVRIRLFFSKNLPGHLNTVRSYTNDLLSEYQTFSKGKIQYEFVNANSDERFKEEAEKAEIPPISIEVYEKDKVEFRDIFLGMSIVAGRSTKVIPVIDNTEGLEFLLTNTIKKMTEPRQRNIAYFQPLSNFEIQNFTHQQLPTPENASRFFRMVNNIALIDRTDLLMPLPEKTDMLVINNVVDSLSIPQLYHLDQFIMRGKPVLIFQDRFIADINAPTARLFDNNLLDMLRSYGIFIKPSLVMDAFCFQLSANSVQRGVVVPVNFDYPFFPLIRNFSDSLLVHRNIHFLHTYYSSEVLSFRRSSNDQRLKFTPYLFTSSLSFENGGYPVNNGIEVDTHFRNYANIDFASNFNHPPKNIAGLFQGPLKSYFDDKRIRGKDYISETDNANIFVAGTTSLLNNDILSNSPGNAPFILNIIDYLTGEEDFILMRNRNVSYSPFKNLSSENKQIIKYINLILPSILILLAGLIFSISYKAHKRYVKNLSNFKRDNE